MIIVDIELKEVAWVDGVSRFDSIFKILIPLAFFGITTVFINKMRYYVCQWV